MPKVRTSPSGVFRHWNSSVVQSLTFTGQLLNPLRFPHVALEEFCENPKLAGRERFEFLGFIRSMLSLDPASRLDAETLRGSPWLFPGGSED